MKDLSNFISLKPYKIVKIDQNTSSDKMDELITEAKQTKQFTFVTFQNLIEVEFNQESQSIIAEITISKYHKSLQEKIEQLFAIILDSSNLIQAWGDIDSTLYDWYDHDFFGRKNLYEIRFVNRQQAFKTWYNTTFRHNDNCGQILHFLEIDGPLCTCSHRPYKSSTDNWSLWMAIAFTFHENINKRNDDFRQCLAITKLSMVIQENWNHQTVQNYIKEHHSDQTVKNEHISNIYHI